MFRKKAGTSGNRELWRVTEIDETGCYKFESLCCGLGLDVNSSNKWAYGAQVQVYKQNNDSYAQNFSVIRRGDIVFINGQVTNG